MLKFVIILIYVFIYLIKLYFIKNELIKKKKKISY